MDAGTIFRAMSIKKYVGAVLACISGTPILLKSVLVARYVRRKAEGRDIFIIMQLIQVASSRGTFAPAPFLKCRPKALTIWL